MRIALFLLVILVFLVAIDAKKKAKVEKKRGTLSISISTCNDLFSLTSSYTQVTVANDIDCGGNSPSGTLNLEGAYFDGQGYKIYNYGGNGGGLFKKVVDTTFVNFTIADFSVSGTTVMTGGLVAHAVGSSFQYISIDSVNGNGNTVSGHEKTGGLVGVAYNSNFLQVRIRNTFVTGLKSVGGLAGAQVGTGTVVGCVNYGYQYTSQTPEQLTIVNGTTNVGGLVGYAEGDTSKSGVETGIVKGVNRVGAVFGDAVDFSIDQVWVENKVTVIANGEDTTAGGLIGRYGLDW